MMDSLLLEFKEAWHKPNNALPQLIIINVGIFLVLAVLKLITSISGFSEIFTVINAQFSIPPVFSDFATRPWTLLTYAFAHDLRGVMHILFNMLVLYWFGKLIVEYIGNQKLINLYIMGALAGGVLYLIMFNVVPYYIQQSHFSGMVGASAAVYAITLAAATLVPEYTFHLMFIGPVKIKYIAGVYILISFLGMTGSNAGGNIAHLGGAIMGFVYIKQLQSGIDYGKWVAYTMRFFKSFFAKQAPMKVSNQQKNKRKTTSTVHSMANNMTNQATIDKILDKISKSGYESLSAKEKQQLFNASNKD